METWVPWAGYILIAVSLIDLFLTVLYARSGAGILAPFLAKGVWRFFLLFGRNLGSKGAGVLSFAGPVILLLTASAWLLLLVVGFALVFFPELGTGLKKSLGPTPTGFWTALYYSGFSLTTLGIGDIAPTSAYTRLLTVVEAALGFSILTLTVTYLLSVYGALQRRNTLASILHHKTSGTGDPRLWIVSLGEEGNAAVQDFSNLASRVADLVEAHSFYPVLHYFHFRHLRYGIPRVSLILLDGASLVKTLPLPHGEKLRASASQVETAVFDLLERLRVFLVSHSPEQHEAREKDIAAWRAYHREALEKLLKVSGGEAGIPEGEDRYVELRRRWHPFILASSYSLGYRPEDIVPAPELP